jgi:DNA-binding SARP family transcriptional activator
VLPVDRLVDLLWTGPAPATAATMVHGAVAGLRRALGPAAALLAGALRERHARH